jgi:membrane-associated phospholipid phosphatase
MNTAAQVGCFVMAEVRGARAIVAFKAERPDRQTIAKLVIIAAILVADVVWIAATDFVFHLASAAKAAGLIFLLLAVGWFYRTRRPIRKFEVVCTETALLLGFSAAGAVLSYLVTSFDRPLIDDQLVAIDAALGFDWMTYVAAVNERPWLGVLSTSIYVTTLSQVALTVIVLGLLGDLERTQHFVSAVMVGALICILISGLLPSAGALGTLRPPVEFYSANQPLVDLDYKQVFFDLRNGAQRYISLDSLHGLIAFPSYHATLSMLIVLAFAGRGAWFWPLLVLNGAVVLSTPIDGGHHLVDALGGGLVAVVAWHLAASLSGRAAPGRQRNAFGQAR